MTTDTLITGTNATDPGATAHADPAKADPAKAAAADPAKADPAQVDPAKADPAKADPAAADPAKADPAKADPAKAEGAPENYEDFTAPEGVTFNPEVMDEFKTLAKEKNLSQEDAQKFAELGAKAAKAQHDAVIKQIETAQAQWAESSKTDKEFGGDNLNANLAVAKKAIDAFGTPELTKLLNESGLGNHPEVIRAFYRAGKAISEDKLVPGGRAPATPDARKFYPNSNHSA